ncbi:hypothetical protein ACWEFJ_07670 [Actinosynnema sp. NPDC004786]
MPRRQSTGRHRLATPARDREHPTKALLLFAAFALTVVAAFLLGHQQGGDAAIAEPPVSRAPADLVEDPAEDPADDPAQPTTPSEPEPAEPTPADEPAADEPADQEQATEEPTAQEPIAEEPPAESVTADEPAADLQPVDQAPVPAPQPQSPRPATPQPVTPQPVFEVLADRSREPEQAEEPVEPVEPNPEPEPTPDDPTPPTATPEVHETRVPETPEVYGTPVDETPEVYGTPYEPTAPETYLVPLDHDLNPVPCPDSDAVADGARPDFPTPILVGPDADGPFTILPAGR